MKKLFILLIAFCSSFIFAQNSGIIPTPKEISWGSKKLNIQNSTLLIEYKELEFKESPQISQLLSQFTDLLIQNFNISIYNPNKKQNQSDLLTLEIRKIDISKIPESNKEGYILQISENNITVLAPNAVGIFYGIQSLKLLFQYHHILNQPISTCQIIDYPSLPLRGWMDDINRGPIPTVAFIKQEIQTLSAFKLNFFNLYTESVFRSKQFPDIAPIDGLTKEEILDIQEFANLHFVQFIPNQQAFGHMEKMLANPFYKELGDDGYILNPGNPKTYQFLDQYLSEIAPLYQSTFFNINCDETESLGNGRAKHYVDSVGKSQAYMNHILKVYEILKKQGKTTMMWADIIGIDSNMVKQLPKDVIPIYWAYHVSSSFQYGLIPLKNSELKFFVAPGTSSWGSILPDYNTYTENIAVLVRDGFLNGAMGMLNTSWDDSGESLFQSLWHAHTWGGEISWNPCTDTNNILFQIEFENRLKNFNSTYSLLRFGVDGYSNLAHKVDKLRKILPEGVGNFHNSWNPLLKTYPSQVTAASDSLNEEVIREGLLLKLELKQFQNKCLYQKNDIDFLIYVVDRYIFNAQKNRTRKSIDYAREVPMVSNFLKTKQELIQLNERLFELKKEYINLWENECRVHHLDHNLKKYDQVAFEIQEIPYFVEFSSFNKYASGFTTPIKSKLKVDDIDQVIHFQTLFGDQDIFYTLDGSIPNEDSKKYSKLIPIDRSCLVKTVVYDLLNQPIYKEQFILQHHGVGTISKLNTPFSSYKPEYSGGCMGALGDGKTGSSRFDDGCWQGYQGDNISVDYDFRTPKQINNLSARFVHNCLGWILAPDIIEIYVSNDGKKYTLYKSIEYPTTDEHHIGIIERATKSLQIKTQYLRIVIKNKGPLPSWHTSPGADSYLFCDEIILN